MNGNQILKLKVLWLKNVLGLSIDCVALNHSYPLTHYYFWPKTEAWEQLKLELDSKSWLSEKEKIITLNLATDLINYWRTSRNTESFDNIKNKFCDATFVKFHS